MGPRINWKKRQHHRNEGFFFFFFRNEGLDAIVASGILRMLSVDGRIRVLKSLRTTP